MVNKTRFHITKVKKALHKVGKLWVVMSTAILGLVAGGTLVAHNVQANVNHDVDYDMQNNNSLATQKTSSANVDLVQNNGSQLGKDVSYSVSKSTSVNSDSMSNTGSNVTSVARNIHKEILKHSINKINNRLQVGKNADDQALINNGLVSIINNNVKNGYNPANAKKAYTNLITFMKPESPLLSNAKLSGTDWITGLHQVQSDLSTINANGQPQPALSKVIINLNHVIGKANNVSSGMFGDLLNNLHYSLGDLAVRFDTPGGFAHSILQEFIPDKDTLDQTGAVMRTLSSIDDNPMIKTCYTDAINDLQKLPNQNRNQQSVTLNDLSNQTLDLTTLINRSGDGYLPSQDQIYFNEFVSGLNKVSTDAHDESVIMKSADNKPLNPNSDTSTDSNQSTSSSSQSPVSSASVSPLSSSISSRVSQTSTVSSASSVTSLSSNASISNQSAASDYSSASTASQSVTNEPNAETNSEASDIDSQVVSGDNNDRESNDNSAVSSHSSASSASQSANTIASNSSSDSNFMSSIVSYSASDQPISVLSSIVSNIVTTSSSVDASSGNLSVANSSYISSSDYSYSNSNISSYNSDFPSVSSSTMNSFNPIISLATSSVQTSNYQAPESTSASHDRAINNTEISLANKVKTSMDVTQVPANYRWFTVGKSCLAHNRIGSVGEIRDYQYVLHPGDLIQLRKIFKVSYGNHSVYRYEVKIHGRNYFVTGNYKFTQEAYYQDKDLKRHHSDKAKVIKSCFAYRNGSRVDKLHRGETIRIKRVVRVGRNGVARFELTNGMFVTSNRLYVKLI